MARKRKGYAQGGEVDPYSPENLEKTNEDEAKKRATRDKKGSAPASAADYFGDLLKKKGGMRVGGK